MVSDRVEQDVYIAASVSRVWEVVTEPQHVGMWFGNGEPAEIELRPGGRIVFDYRDDGQLAAVIEKVEEPRYLSFRWAADDETGGEEPTQANVTLVEFMLEPEREGTRLRVVESGFTAVTAEADALERRYRASAAGWGRALFGLAGYAEFLTYDEEAA